jgi:chromosome partitioning protein
MRYDASRSMKTLVFANQKGGTGKTTLSAHLAVEAGRRGERGALIDTDPQGSLSAWWNAREAKEPLLVQASPELLGEASDALKKQGVKWLFIDTPPALSKDIRRVCAFADIILIPVRPSPHDLRSVGATVTLAESLSKPIVFVVNSATKRARITGEAAIALSQHGTVAPVMVGHRVDFASSMTDGRTARELDPASPSADEVKELWDYVLTRLRK